MKIFLSSVISGFERYRDAAAVASSNLGHEVRRAEDFSARPSTPQVTCLDGVRWADVVVVVLGERYGTVQASGLSATHEEFREAKSERDVLAFVEEGVEPEAQQAAFIREVQDWSHGALTKSFRTPEELRAAVTKALHDLDLARAVGPVDEKELLERAQSLVPDDRYGSAASTITVVVVGGPQREILRPAEMESPELIRRLSREAVYGELAVFDPSEGVDPRIDGDALVLHQPTASLYLDQLGSIRITQPANRNLERRGPLLVMIEEEVAGALARGLRFGAWILDDVDPAQRLSEVVVIASVERAGLGWKTRVEHERDPNTISGMFSESHVAVTLARPVRHRASLKHDADKLAEDLTVLLRRALRR